MTDLDLRRMILAKEIKRSKAYVGASVVEAIDEEREKSYIDLLNDVISDLDNAIKRLEAF